MLSLSCLCSCLLGFLLNKLLGKAKLRSKKADEERVEENERKLLTRSMALNKEGKGKQDHITSGS